MNTTTITLPEDQEIKREKEVKVRLTKEEHYVLREKAHKSGKQLAVYVREAALRKELKVQLTPEELELYVAYRQTFIKLCNNLHQLHRQLEKEGYRKNAEKVEGLIKEIDEKLKQ